MTSGALARAWTSGCEGAASLGASGRWASHASFAACYQCSARASRVVGAALSSLGREAHRASDRVGKRP